MRDSGQTINLSARDSERECAASGQAGPWGRRERERGRGQARDCNLLERRPNGEGQREASTGRGL